jgi:hypothetical protein
MTQNNYVGTAYQMAVKGSAEASVPTRAVNAELNTASDEPDQKPYQGVEKRRSARFKCIGKVEMYEDGCDAPTFATFSDISLHGCYVETQATYPVGTAFRIKLEANGHKIEATGRVRVNYPYAGMGIALEMTDENRAHMKALLASIMRPVMVMSPSMASSLSAHGSKESVPLISDPGTALQALIDFFESKQTLTRDDFVRVLRQSQSVRAKS